jgi:hypothetical protein
VIDVIALLGIDLCVAADTFQALGGLGFEVRVDNDTTNALFVDPFTLNVEVIVWVNTAANGERQLRDLVQCVFKWNAVAFVLEVIVVVRRSRGFREVDDRGMGRDRGRER